MDWLCPNKDGYEMVDSEGGGGSRNLRPLLLKISIAVIALVIIGAIVGLAVGLTVGASDDDDDDAVNVPLKLEDAMAITNLMAHLQTLETITANFTNNSRSVLNGYNVSKDYVVQTLTASGYTSVVQPFTLTMSNQITPTTLVEVSPKQLKLRQDIDFAQFRTSPNGNLSGVALFVANNLGCVAEDFLNFTTGNIALIKRGNCTFMAKALLAQAAGASAAIIYAEESAPGLFVGAVDDPTVTIPVFSVTFFIGENWKCQAEAGNTVRVDAVVNSQFFTAYTSNVITETADGDGDNIVFVGSHLDSVPAGPGINDNGSGSSLNLELAIQLAKLKVNVKNKVRFAWWGAEELGLLGSKAYVANLNATSPADLKKIAIYINLDMVGSPNYIFGIYDGSAAIAPNGSYVLMKMFTDYVTQNNQNYTLTEFNGRSDYGPFIQKGIDIPAGGLFSGAEQIKSMADRTAFGGIANAAYDPCYHQRCDTVENVHQPGFLLFARAAAYVVAELAGKENLRAFLLGQ